MLRCVQCTHSMDLTNRSPRLDALPKLSFLSCPNEPVAAPLLAKTQGRWSRSAPPLLDKGDLSGGATVYVGERSGMWENVSSPHTARDGESAISSVKRRRTCGAEHSTLSAVRPKTGYHFFLRTESARSVAQNTGGAKQPGCDVVRALGRRWAAMAVATKEEWNQAAREDYELRVQGAQAAARAATVAAAAAEAAEAACAALPHASSPHASFISSCLWRCKHCDRRWYVAACSCVRSCCCCCCLPADCACVCCLSPGLAARNSSAHSRHSSGQTQLFLLQVQHLPHYSISHAQRPDL